MGHGQDAEWRVQTQGRIPRDSFNIGKTHLRGRPSESGQLCGAGGGVPCLGRGMRESVGRWGVLCLGLGGGDPGVNTHTASPSCPVKAWALYRVSFTLG